MVSNDLPDPGPLQSDAAHVVVGDLYYFLKAEHAWVCGRGQLIHGHSTQPAHEINCQDRREDKENSRNDLGMKLESRLTYGVTIQSGGTSEYPMAETY